jgi:hypothetical protein
MEGPENPQALVNPVKILPVVFVAEFTLLKPRMTADKLLRRPPGLAQRLNRAGIVP